MTSAEVRVERRAAQRFDFHLPVSVKLMEGGPEGTGFTQDLSVRGAFFYTDFPLAEGVLVELTLMMPSEITLAESMRVRCRGRVLRVTKPSTETQVGVAVQLEGYEFLPDARPATETPGAYGRISALHQNSSGSQDSAPPTQAYRARG